MKGTRAFLFILLLLAIGVFMFQRHNPRHFVWSPTFLHTDKQPFGCYVFDSLVSRSFNGRYVVTGKTPYQLLREGNVKNKALLLINTDEFLDSLDVLQLSAFAQRGGTVIVVYDRTYGDDDYANEQWGMGVYGGNNFNLELLRKEVLLSDSIATSRLIWPKDPPYPHAEYSVYTRLHNGGISIMDSTAVKSLCYKIEDSEVVTDTDGNTPETDNLVTVVAERNIGAGKVILSNMPLLFTNYGMLNDATAPLVMRVLNRARGKTLIRTEAYNRKQTEDDNGEEHSFLDLFMASKPLLWSYYTALFGLFLFMFFTARRRQRAIPVVKKPKDVSLDFVKLIGTLYYREGDHLDLVQKKYRYFMADLRERWGVNLEDDDHWEQSVAFIAAQTGRDYEDVVALLTQLRTVYTTSVEMSKNDMKYYVDSMNRITDELENRTTSGTDVKDVSQEPDVNVE